MGVGGGFPRSPSPSDPDKDIHLENVVVGAPQCTGALRVAQYDLVRQYDIYRAGFLRTLGTKARGPVNVLSAIVRGSEMRRNTFHNNLPQSEKL